MDRTERFYKIELLLRNRGCVSFEALRDELQVSPATLKRDLQYLRDRMDAPIAYDRADNGYRFAHAAGSSRTRQHELPGLWFSEQEIHALLTMHQLVAGLDDDGVLARHLAADDGQAAGHAGRRRQRGARADAPRQGDRHRAPACAQQALRAAGQRPDAAPAGVAALLQAQRPQRERARGLAAAPGQLPQHLVPGRLVPRQRGPAPLCARRRAGGPCARAPAPAPWR